MGALTIATRGSRLALWQATHVKKLLEDRHGLAVELLVLKTKGDIILDVPLSKVGGKGLFVKEIEEALLDGRADIAVHSMKDVPMKLPDGLTLAVVPKREDPVDLLLAVRYADLDSLPQGAVVGTSSLRRQAQVLSRRPDLSIIALRGNVDTRLKKLLNGEFDAIIMAAAGMNRLGLTAPRTYALAPPDFLPAAGQGALGIEISENRQDLKKLLAFLNHPHSFACVTAERAFLADLEGGCQVPIAAYATIDNSLPDGSLPEGATLSLEGLVADVTGKRLIRKHAQGDPYNADAIGRDLAKDVRAAGGEDILRELYGVATQ